MSGTNDDPYAGQLPESGSAIWVWLIIGGALLVVFITLWEKRSQGFLMAESADVEEAVRENLRRSLADIRAGRYEKVVARYPDAEAKLKRLVQMKPGGYVGMRVLGKFLYAEAIARREDPGQTQIAERIFTEGIELIGRSGGSLWESGLLGRAKARHSLGRDADAETDLNILLAFNPSFGAAYYWRSLARAKLGDDAGAEADKRRAVALGSWPPTTGFVPTVD